jgi:phytoene synthase
MQLQTSTKPLDQLAVHDITEKSRSNFASSFFFLSPEKKQAIQAVYAFSRLVDDAVDESASPMEATEKLAMWSQEIEKTYEGKENSNHPVMRELAGTISRFSIPKKYFDELIKGVAQDLDHHRYESFEELCQYTYGVASVVGLICMKIFEVKGDDAEEAAILLGRALQLTNILRDIKTDAMQGRIYLPLKDLEQFNLTEDEILKGLASTKLDSLMNHEIQQTEAIYNQAFRLLKKLPRKPLVAAWMMGKVYYQILQEIKKNPRLPLKGKVSLSKFTKIRIVFVEWMKSWFCSSP